MYVQVVIMLIVRVNSFKLFYLSIQPMNVYVVALGEDSWNGGISTSTTDFQWDTFLEHFNQVDFQSFKLQLLHKL